MSTETKPILLMIVVCATAISLMGYKCEKQKSELAETIVETRKEVEEITEKYASDVETEDIVVKEEYVSAWTVAKTDIKKEPNENSETVGNYHWNTKVCVVYIDDDWAKIKETEHYINRDFISENPVGFTNYNVPDDNTIKSYMDYRYITSTISSQYKLQKSKAYTGNYGIRMVNERYCIALGSYYTTTIGQYIDIELEDGSVIQGILADCKDDKHTDSTNRINPNGSVVEFVVDTDNLDGTAKIMGDISYVNGWGSKIVNIKVYDKVEKF